MVIGIISNIAANSAQINLQQASDESQASIARLSSGNAINHASDDVGGLAVGTILKTNVSTLKAALSNTAQAQSMLGVADGALSNVGDILQRQMALATESTSGSLSAQARSFLNKEFSSLTSEIDRISSTTNFNGINLIDGSLYAPSTMTYDSGQTPSTAASAVLDFTNASFAAADTLTLTDASGAVATFTFQTTMTDNPTDIDLTTNTTAGNVAALEQAINDTLTSVSTTASVVTAKNVLAGFNFTYDTVNSKITITAKNGGTVENTAAISSVSAGGASGDLTFGGANVIGASAAMSAGTAGVNNDLHAGAMASSINAYNGTETTVAQGNVGDNILKALTTTAKATTGVNASGISNNAAFVGTIAGFKANYAMEPGYVNMEVTVGDYTYKAAQVNTSPTAATIVRFSVESGAGGYFDLQIDSATNTSQAAVANQTDADGFATRINKALSNVSFFQKREVANYQGSGSVYPVGSTTSNGNLAGSSFTFINNNFTDIEVESISVQAPSQGGSNASITLTINGEDYVSGYSGTGAVLASGLTTQITSGSYGFVNVNDAKKVLVLNYASSTALDMSTSINAQGVQNALAAAFNINTGASNLTFQVGTTASDNIAVQIQSTQTKDIFKDSFGTYTALDISTQGGASDATAILTNAINSVTSTRAQVGALESRFNYATNNLNVTIQNQDAARGTFLDADISIESTKFAQSQVRVQASIAVLAQANQLPQSLLKLIG